MAWAPDVGPFGARRLLHRRLQVTRAHEACARPLQGFAYGVQQLPALLCAQVSLCVGMDGEAASVIVKQT